jgi:hypothetical protein
MSDGKIALKRWGGSKSNEKGLNVYDHFISVAGFYYKSEKKTDRCNHFFKYYQEKHLFVFYFVFLQFHLKVPIIYFQVL